MSARPAAGQHAVSCYVPLLIAGDLAGLLALFADAPRVNDPRLGWVEGASFAPFVAASALGLAERKASVEHRATTVTALGAVEECVLSLVRSGITIHLPVAVAAVLGADALRSVHVYHSMGPLMGAHALRPPLLPPRAALVLPDVVDRYHARMEAGDAAGIVGLFEAGGVVCEPEGEHAVHRGRDELRGYFERMFVAGGSDTERCALTDDGEACALEYNLTAWGGARVRPQAGIAVYERGQSGMLAAVRLYDDFDRAAPAA